MQSSAVIRFILSILVSVAMPASAAFNARLQGQSRGSTTWLDGNLKDWRDLDFVPCRVYLTGGPANNKVIVVEFDHAQGRNPAIANLCKFTPSANVLITSAPVLSAPVNSPRWSYTFTIKLLDNKPGWVLFNAKVAAGAHLNGGSSVGMRGSPSLGSLQLHKIAPAAPTPAVIDLALMKFGPAQAAPGEIITYTLQYSNKTTSTIQATNVQITDVLPVQVTPENLGSGRLVGNSVVWDIGGLNAGGAATVSYTVRVSSNAAFGEVFTNSASIVSSQPDANSNDNSASVITHILMNRAPIANPDSYQGRENQPLIVGAPGVLANDSDADNDTLTAILVSAPAHGTVVFNADGSFTYTPSTSYSGSDAFTYKANDGMADSSAVAVNILLLPNPKENHAPLAVNDQYGTTTNSTLNVPARGVLTNDSDPDNDPLSAILVGGPVHGTLALNPNGSFQYIPAPGFAGIDAFTYKA
ncbi:MAG TPA: Ig-like domain-containing protein, partial [Verrucomicrobiae bacterium]|nr:Ig-like domain-containing protein [Verrucomicrobiae bacterium]